MCQEELSKVARRPLVELGAQELEEVEGLQETLAEDLDGHQAGIGGKRDAEETHVGTPTKKRKYGRGEIGCDHCGKKYSSKTSLSVHLKKCHQAVIKKEHVMELGGDVSTGDVSLDVTGEVETTDDMGESIVELDHSLNSSQEQSEQLEQDVKKFACDLCDKKFVSEQGRRTHKTRKHGSDQPLLLACDYQDCAQAFLKNSELRKHEIAMHNRVPRSWKSKNVKKEPVVGSVYEYNSGEEVVAEESDVDSSVAEDAAEDVSTEVVDTAEDRVNMDDVAEDEDVTAKYQDVPADSDTSLDLADVVAVDQENQEVILDCYDNFKLKSIILGIERGKPVCMQLWMWQVLLCEVQPF